MQLLGYSGCSDLLLVSFCVVLSVLEFCYAVSRLLVF